MKSWGRFIIIFLAYGLTLLHTVVPHHHGTARNGKTVLTSLGCALPQTSGGLLQRALSTDLGIGHLENFRKGADAEIEVNTTPILFAGFVPEAISIPEKPIAFPAHLRGHIDKFHKLLLLFSTSHLRAPPLA